LTIQYPVYGHLKAWQYYYSHFLILKNKVGLWDHVAVCVCIPPIVARQRLSGKVTAITNTHATIEELKSTIFWDITQCSPLSTDVSEEHIASILRVEEISPARNQRARRWQAGFPLVYCWIFLRPWGWRRYVPPKRRWTLNGLHGVISQKMVLFVTTAMKTSNPNRRIVGHVVFNVARDVSRKVGD
jgi:hypothetical protein